jgi:hypothetical protein
MTPFHPEPTLNDTSRTDRRASGLWEPRLSNTWGIRGSCGGDVPIERRGGDAQAVRDLGHADIGIGEHRFGGLDVVVRELGRPASGAANAARGGKARLGALPDQAALKFRQRAKHVKNKPTLRGRRVEGFGKTAETDASHPQFLDGFDQLLHRARQAVELPHDQRVAAAREFQCLAQGWSIRHRARQLLGENSSRIPLQRARPAARQDSGRWSKPAHSRATCLSTIRPHRAASLKLLAQPFVRRGVLVSSPRPYECFSPFSSA